MNRYSIILTAKNGSSIRRTMDAENEHKIRSECENVYPDYELKIKGFIAVHDTKKMQYEINLSDRTCLPQHTDRSNFIDITTACDRWRQFLDLETGKIHDCEEYYNQAIGSACNNHGQTLQQAPSASTNNDL